MPCLSLSLATLSLASLASVPGRKRDVVATAVPGLPAAGLPTNAHAALSHAGLSHATTAGLRPAAATRTASYSASSA